MTHPNPTFFPLRYDDPAIWTPTFPPVPLSDLFAADLYSPGAAIDGGDGSNSYVTKVGGGVSKSGDTAVTMAIWWKGGDLTTELALADLLIQFDSPSNRQFLFRVQAGSLDHGRIGLFVYDSGGSNFMSLSDDRFDDGENWYLFFARANSSSVGLYYATPGNSTLTEVTYKSQDIGSFTSMGGAGAALRTGEEIHTPDNDQLFGLNSRPAIWKNQFLTVAQMQSFATEQIGLISDGLVPLIVKPSVSIVVPKML